MTNRAIEWLDRVNDLAGADAFALALAIKATLLVLLGAAAVFALSRAGAATRHLGWALTVVGLLALPALLAWAPALDLPVLPEEGAAPVAATEAGGAPLAADPGADPGSAAAAPAPRSAALTPVGAPGPAPGAQVSEPSPGNLASGLWLAWFLGMAACLAYLAVGLARVAWLGRRADPVDDDPAWRDEIEALRSGMGVRPPVSVRLSDRVAVPLAYGLRRPVVLLPGEARGWDDAQRRDVLMHELAHVARRDWPMQLASRLASALYWFHPLVWWSARRLALEAERACDDRVLLAGSDSCGYAERLLAVASGGRQLPDPSYAAVAMARRTDLATRIRSILDGRVRRHGLRALPAVLVAVALLIPLAALSTARLARAEAPAAEAAAEPSPEPRPEPSPEPRPEPRPEPDPEPGPEARPAPRASEGSSPLITAAFRGDLDEVRRRLDAGDDPNQVVNPPDRRSGIQRSALGSAARGGHLEVAELLLDRGARIDLVPRGDATALITAAEQGHRPVVEMLLSRGADPNRVVKGDGSPLIAATRSGDRELARLLLDAGADPNTWVDGDESPLYHAVSRGDEAMVRMLLEAGADPDVEMPGDGNALIEAVRGDRPELVALLVEAGADPDHGVEGDGSPLIEAAGSGDLATVRYLLDVGADPDTAVEGDGNPLIAASRNGRLDVARELVGAGADIDRVVPGDENPLIQAAGEGHLEVVRYLLDMGADPNVRVVIPASDWRPEGEVRTALSMARRGGHSAVVELLRARGARE